MQTLPPIKRGDTFLLGCVAKDSAGVPENLDDVTLKAQARKCDAAGTLVADLTITKANQTTHAGQFSISADTSLWPLDALVIDIQTHVGTVQATSETMEITVMQEVTRD